MNRNRIVSALLIAAVLGAVTGIGNAQKGKSYRRPAARRVQQPAGFTFGSISVLRYSEIKWIPGTSVTAEGPDTTVESIDKETGTVSRLTARKIVATMNKANEVDRVDATGGVRFTGSRPLAESKGAQDFNGTGTRATYFKLQGRIVVDGPVTYAAEQPVAGQKTVRQWVRGTASEAMYDDKGRSLTLTGNVKAKAFDPGTMPADKPADIVADKVVVDMTKQPYEYRILNNQPDSGQVRIPVKQQPKKEPQKNP